MLGRPKTAGVPVVLVGTDTLTAVDRAEDVVRSARIRESRTIQRVDKLVAEHADVAAMVDLEEPT